jgi:bacteriorhodopsin
MTWLLALVACFVFLGTRRRPPRISVYMTAFILILMGVAYQTLKLHLL